MAAYGNHALGRALSAVAGGIAGLAVAAVIVLNLHILVGLEDGYAAGPREVWDASPLLAVLDVGLLVAGPVIGALAVRNLSRRAT